MSIDSSRTVTGLPADASERALAARHARMAADERRVRAALDGLSEHYRSERIRLLGAEKDSLLREFTVAHRRPAPTDGPVARPTEEERRAAREGTARFAAEHRIDLGLLDPLHADIDRRFRRIAEPQQSPEVEVTELPDGPASPNKAFTSFGSWDAGGSWWFSNSHRWLERFDSHFLPAWNRTGSHIRMHMWNTDDEDRFDGHRNNGYLVEYQLPTTRQVTIKLDVTCAFSEHELYGDDEWGVSDCHAAVYDRGLFEVYSGWDDYTPDAQNYSWGLSPFTSIWGADYKHQYPVVPGARRQFSVRTSTVFPYGQTILVYAGTHQWATTKVNDTSIMAGINSSWYVNTISVY